MMIGVNAIWPPTNPDPTNWVLTVDTRIIIDETVFLSYIENTSIENC